MTISLLPLLSYVVISTFTPGPSNISSASVAVLHGFKKTLNYQAGLAAGVFCIMVLSGSVSALLLRVAPAVELILRYAGAAYILYLAWGILRASYTFTEPAAGEPSGVARAEEPLGFVHGFVLQVLNIKLLVYAFTLFTAFLAPIADSVLLVIMAAALLAAISFAATSCWALFGTVIKTYLRNPRLNTVINIMLALSLVYTAAALAGII